MHHGEKDIKSVMNNLKSLLKEKNTHLDSFPKKAHKRLNAYF